MVDTTKFTLELDNQLIKKIDEVARKSYRSRVAQIRTILNEHFNQKCNQ